MGPIFIDRRDLMRPYILFAATAAILLALAAGDRPVIADAPQAVTVTNFPEVQQISGRVVVSEPIPQTRFETRKAIVAPSELSDTAHLTDAGTLETAGFTHVTLSLSGLLQGSAQAGAVGVVLVPDVPEVTTALRTHGVLQLGLRAEARITPAPAGLFSSETATFRLGFPRYRVLLYNGTQKSAETTVYAYLSTS
jgi:hypothetical protein